MKVELYDSMGSDLTVVDAARVSFNKQSKWEESCSCGGTPHYGWPCTHGSCGYGKTLLGGDKKLIEYLAAHHHWLPFRHPALMFRCKAPIFVARQAVKHQVGMNWSEVSRRYVDDEPEFYWPKEWRGKPHNKKQGSSDDVVNREMFHGLYTEMVEDHAEDAVVFYQNMLDAGVAPELARIILPQNMYTEWMWSGSLLAFAHFVKQRTEEHAQKEIQDFANLFIPHIAERFPESWAALMRHYNF